MMWVLFSPTGDLLARGSWWEVISAGEDEGALIRRYSHRDGREACPKMERGFVMAPAGLFPELTEYGLVPAPASAHF